MKLEHISSGHADFFVSDAGEKIMLIHDSSRHTWMKLQGDGSMIEVDEDASMVLIRALQESREAKEAEHHQ